MANGLAIKAPSSAKVVYLVITGLIKKANCDYLLLANELSAMAEGFDGSLRLTACIVRFNSKAAARQTAQLLADLMGFWHYQDSTIEIIPSQMLSDKDVHCNLEDVCLFHDPNGLIDIPLVDKNVNDVVAIPQAKSQLLKRLVSAFGKVVRYGIVPNWEYDTAERSLIWKTYQAKLTTSYCWKD